MNVSPPEHWVVIENDTLEEFLNRPDVDYRRDGFGNGTFYAFKNGGHRFAFVEDEGKCFADPKLIMDRPEQKEPEPQFMGEITMTANQISERMQHLMMNVQENMVNNPDNQDQDAMIKWGAGFFSSDTANANFLKQFGREMTLRDASMVSATILYFWAVNSLLWDQMNAAKN